MRERHGHPKGPNFLAVVIAAVIAMFLIFVIALVILSMRGKKDLPLNHKTKKAQIRWPSRAQPAEVPGMIYRL